MLERCPECDQLGGHLAGCKKVAAVADEKAKARKRAGPSLRSPLITVIISLGIALSYQITYNSNIDRMAAQFESTLNNGRRPKDDEFAQALREAFQSRAAQIVFSPNMAVFRNVASTSLIVLVIASIRLMIILVKRADKR